MITVNQLKEFSLRYLDEQSLELIYMLRELELIMPLSEELIVYPKNLYLKNKSIELYVFTPDKRLVIIKHQNKETLLSTRLINNLKVMEYRSSDQKRELTFSFLDGTTISLSPKSDTTTSYISSFNEQIILIVRYLHHSA